MRELTVLGTASQVPTRHRNHNGYLLRWDGEAILFDPGEGTQRQMMIAGIPASALTRICITHFHGDHSLGLPGVVQRIALDRVPHQVSAHFPAGGRAYYDRLRHATAFHDVADIRPEPVGLAADGHHATVQTSAGTLEALPLRHSIETYGYRLVEADGRRMLPERLRAYQVSGPAVAELQRVGHLDTDAGRVTLGQVSARRPGQRFAFVMDTGLCDNVFALAQDADLLVIEATFLAAETEIAGQVGHLTAGQAGWVADQSRVRTLLLTHFSQRYADSSRFRAEAGEQFAGEIIVAEDLMRVPVPARVRGLADEPAERPGS